MSQQMDRLVLSDISNCAHNLTTEFNIAAPTGENSLTTSWNITKVMMNPNIPKAATFSHISSSEVHIGTQSTSHFPPGSQNCFNNDLSNPELRRSIFEIRDAKEVVSIFEIRDAKEPQRVTTLATVHEIIEDYNWFYPGCNKCSMFVKPKEPDGALYCNKCQAYPSLVIPRYKVYLRVMDHTDNASFVLFDKEAFKLFHKPAADLKNDLIKEGDGLDVSNILKDYPLPHTLLGDNESGSVTGDNDTDNCTTPVISASKKKKSINTENDYVGITEIPTPQFSTTKSPMRKIPARINMEKLHS